MNVAVVGPGRVGGLLTVALARAGHRVVAVAGGTAAAREAVVARVAGVRPVETAADAARGADLIVLAVPDDAVEPVARDLVRADAVGEGQRLVHVAGSLGLGVLDLPRRAGARVAACHPAMTVPAGADDPSLLHGVAWAVTATPADQGWATALVTDLGGDAVAVEEHARVLYHAGLSLASNAVGAAVAAGRQALLAAGVADPARFLGPLAHVSVDNVVAGGAAALTGPVVRGDAGTVERHLAALDADVPSLAAAYRALATAVLEQAAPALDEERRARLRAVLEARP